MTQHRTETFVPLTASSATPAGRREFKVSVIRANNAPDNSFNSLEAPPAPPPLPAPAGDRKMCEPRVTVQRDNGRVTSVRIQCTCGQILDLACSYDLQSPMQ